MKGIKLGKRIKLNPIHVMLLILSMSFLILAYCMYEMNVYEGVSRYVTFPDNSDNNKCSGEYEPLTMQECMLEANDNKKKFFVNPLILNYYPYGCSIKNNGDYNYRNIKGIVSWSASTLCKTDLVMENKTNIATNKTSIGTNTTSIDTNTTSIGTINTRLSEIQSNYVNKTELEEKGSKLETEMDSKINNNNAKITQKMTGIKTEIIDTVEKKIDYPLTELARFLRELNKQETS